MSEERQRKNMKHLGRNAMWHKCFGVVLRQVQTQVSFIAWGYSYERVNDMRGEITDRCWRGVGLHTAQEASEKNFK